MQRMQSQNQSQMPIPDLGAIRAIITEGRPETLVEWADRIGEALVNHRVTTNQLRNVFGTVRQIQMAWDSDPVRAYRDTILLKPKLGYFARRYPGRGMADLERILVPAIDEIAKAEKEAKTKEEQERIKKERFMRFADLVEAIVAYHKKYGGN